MQTKLALSPACWASSRTLRWSACLFALCVGSACSDSATPDNRLLSTRGLYSEIASRKPVKAALEFEPDYPLWSDGVQKRRWIILPQGRRIDTSDMDHWEFPVGTKLFKEFALYGQLLETRLVERVGDSGKITKDYLLTTFVWREDQSDAEEITGGVQDVLGTDHNVPPQKVCLDCHRGEPGAILGLSALQLSRNGLLGKLAERDWLSVDPKRTYLLPGDEIESAAAGYMHANCGHCHSANGQAPGSMHLRFSVNEVDNPIAQSELYETTIHQPFTEWKDHPEELHERVVPGDPEHSALYYRMKQRGDEMPSPDQMPPLATEKMHLEGVAVVKAWIELLEEPAQPGEQPKPGEQPMQAGDAASPEGGSAKAPEPDSKSMSRPKPAPDVQGDKAADDHSVPASQPDDAHAAPDGRASQPANTGDVPSAGAVGLTGASPADNAGASGAAGAPARTSLPPTAGNNAGSASSPGQAGTGGSVAQAGAGAGGTGGAGQAGGAAVGSGSAGAPLEADCGGSGGSVSGASAP